MLPSSKPKHSKQTSADEVELDEADLVSVQPERAPQRGGRARASLPLPTLPPLRTGGHSVATRAARTRTLTPRRILDEHVEELVAGECLASIASLADLPPPLPAGERMLADPESSSHVRRAARRPGATALPPPLPAAARANPGPADDALTTPRVPLPPDLPAAPAAAFVRRSSAHLAAGVAPSAVSSSVAPVIAEPTIIVVRGRPRAGWVLAAAALGAACAVIAGRLVTTTAPAASEPVVVAAAAPPPPAAVTAPPYAPSSLVPTVALPPAAAPAPRPTAVVSFADDQGVAIKAAPRPVVAAPARTSAPAPVKSSGALPDGSLVLGASAASATSAAPPPKPPAPVAAPADPPRRRALTPEQQLAEAQLKASMR